MDLVAEAAPSTRRTLEPVPLDQVPEVWQAMSRLSIQPLEPDDLLSFIGRNDNWAGRTADGRRVLVKRLAGPDRGGRYERSVSYERLAATAPLRFLRSPRLLGADAQAGVLVHELVIDGALATDLEAAGSLDERWSGRLGRALGELHSLPAAPHARADASGERRSGLIHDLTVDEYADSSGATLDVWALLQHDARLATAIDALMDASATVTAVPCHGDLRLDQFLVRDEETFVVDWEEFRAADPALDVGAVAGCWLHRAVSRTFTDPPDLGATPGAIHDAIVAAGDTELAAVRPIVASFWAGYREQRGLEPDEAAGLARRATAYAGLHLLDRTLAASMFGARLSAARRAIAGIGRTALLEPELHVASVGLSGDTADEARHPGGGRS